MCIYIHTYTHTRQYIYIYTIIYKYMNFCILYNKLYFIVLFISANAFTHTLHSSSSMLSGMIAWKRELSANLFLNRKII